MEDWETALKIGHSVRAGAGARENVVKGKGALNAARRSGAVTTEKKFATGNAGPSGEGQLLTKIALSDDIIKPKTVGPEVARAIQGGRKAKNIKTQADLAKLCNTTSKIINDMERGIAAPDQNLLNKMERALGIKLRGNNIGESKFGGPKKSATPAPAAKATPAKTTIKIVPPTPGPPSAKSATPASATPASATPASATPASATPASATPASATPASATPASATPASATPASATPASATPTSATPKTGTPGGADEE